MNIDELKTYKKELTDHRKIYDDEFRKMLTYIAAGALGVLVTLNDKFFNVISSDYHSYLVISLVFLILTFALILLTNHLASEKIASIRKIVEDQITANAPDSIKIEKAKKAGRKFLDFCSYAIMGCLFLGVISEVLFISLNVLNPTTDKSKDAAKFSVQIISKTDTLKIKNDTVVVQLNNPVTKTISNEKTSKASKQASKKASKQESKQESK